MHIMIRSCDILLLIPNPTNPTQHNKPQLEAAQLLELGSTWLNSTQLWFDVNPTQHQTMPPGAQTWTRPKCSLGDIIVGWELGLTLWGTRFYSLRDVGCPSIVKKTTIGQIPGEEFLYRNNSFTFISGEWMWGDMASPWVITLLGHLNRDPDGVGHAVTEKKHYSLWVVSVTTQWSLTLT